MSSSSSSLASLTKDAELLDALLALVNGARGNGVGPHLSMAMPLKRAGCDGEFGLADSSKSAVEEQARLAAREGLLGSHPVNFCQTSLMAMKAADLSLRSVVSAIHTYSIREHLKTIPEHMRQQWTSQQSAHVEERWYDQRAKFFALMHDSLDAFTPEMGNLVRSDIPLGTVRIAWRMKIEDAVLANLGVRSGPGTTTGSSSSSGGGGGEGASAAGAENGGSAWEEVASLFAL